jgi:hypothetical protein
VRAGSALLLAAAAFVAGLLAGRFVVPGAQDAARAPPRSAVAPGADANTDGGRVTALHPAAHALREPTAPDDSPDEDQPLARHSDDAEDGAEFARWYAIHRRAWNLPELNGRDVVRFGRYILSLERIPRRDQLIRLLRALHEWDADVERADAENAAWADANPDAPEDDPGSIACDDRLSAVHQRLSDSLHRELPYGDYLTLWTNIESEMYLHEAVLHPPSSAADAYARSVAIAGDYFTFANWYRAYAPLLGFPERDEEFLYDFGRHLVVPLGRLPEPALMRTLQEVYSPLRARLAGGEEWEDAVKRLFSALDRVLPLLDYERIRHSYEWDRYPELVPPPADR